MTMKLIELIQLHLQDRIQIKIIFLYLKVRPNVIYKYYNHRAT